MSDIKPVIFISYSHKDEPDKPGPDEVAWLTFVQSFLAPVVKIGIFDIWVDEHLHGGDVLDPDIKKKLADCDIFVLLASRFSLASTYVVETEIATIRQRQKHGQDVHMFPIVLSPIPNAALKQLKDLILRPKDGNPLSLMSRNDREVTMTSIADDIANVAEEIAVRKAAIKGEAKTILGRFRTRDALFQELPAFTTARAAVDTAHLPETPYERLVGREAQLKRLDEAWADRHTNVLSLIAEGGAGKSALVNEWLKCMQADHYRGAETVLGWSFYSQGTKERATSAEQFLNWVMEKLCIKIETTSATAKGEAIANALTNRRVLLVLDGCEPLQHGLDKQQGELKDQGLRALLRRFAAAPPDRAHGLVVLTSRLAIKDIVGWKYRSAPIEAIDKLSDEDGAALLRDNAVWGTDKELRAAVRDFGGHPLALGLLASFIKETRFGDVRRRDNIRELLHDEESPRHDHARRVMESYETEWLAAEPIENAIMHLVGLFDRPASEGCLSALCSKPLIAGLNEAIIDLEEGEWRRAVFRLREVRLLAPPDPSAPEALDTHPLVREWFGASLKQRNETAWMGAHHRVYEYLCETTMEGGKPTLEDLAPLFQAIAHGCRAGLYTEVLNSVYEDRICRRVANKSQNFEYYAIRKLGAVGSELAAISWFFERPYDKAVSSLSYSDSIAVKQRAAVCLRALGRFAEVLPILDGQVASLELSHNLSYAGKVVIRRICRALVNLSQVELLVGLIKQAEESATRAINFAFRLGGKNSTSRGVVSGCRSNLAHVLYLGGQSEAAERMLIDIERDKIGSDNRVSLSDLLCDILLGRSDWILALNHSEQTLNAMKSGGIILNIGRCTSLVGRANLGLACKNVGCDETMASAPVYAYAAKVSFDKAIDDLSAAGALEYIARGLIARAAFRRNVGDWDGGNRDLDDVEELAEPGPMKLHLCDMVLERARLAFAQIDAFAPLNGLISDSPPRPVVLDTAEAEQLKDEAEKQLAIAADYIKICGYHRRDEELVELQAVLRGERKFADLPPRV